MGILFEVSGKGKSENTVPGKHLPRLYEGGWRRERTRIPAKANSGEMLAGVFGSGGERVLPSWDRLRLVRAEE